MRENYHRAPRIKENRVPRIREIGFLQVHSGYLTVSLKKLAFIRKSCALEKDPQAENHWLRC